MAISVKIIPDWWGYEMFEIMLGLSLVVVTALMAFFIYRTLHNQSATNSATLIEMYYKEIKRNYQPLWNNIQINYENKHKDISEIKGYRKK